MCVCLNPSIKETLTHLAIDTFCNTLIRQTIFSSVLYLQRLQEKFSYILLVRIYDVRINRGMDSKGNKLCALLTYRYMCADM